MHPLATVEGIDLVVFEKKKNSPSTTSHLKTNKII